MSDPFAIPIAVAVGATTLALLAGLATLVRARPASAAAATSPVKQPVSRSNQLMRARVALQAVAIVLIMAGAALRDAKRQDIAASEPDRLASAQVRP